MAVPCSVLRAHFPEPNEMEELLLQFFEARERHIREMEARCKDQNDRAR
jgi:hypothetical protein